MSGPGPHVDATELREPTRRPHVNKGVAETCDPRPLAALIQATDRAIEAGLDFIDGRMSRATFGAVFERYRTEAVRAGFVCTPAKARHAGQVGCRRDQSRAPLGSVGDTGDG